MKKTIYIAAAALLCAAAVSCQKVENAPAAEQNEITFNFTISSPSADTKAAKTGWVSGDKLNVWFDGNGTKQTVPDLILTYNGSSWDAGTLRAGVQEGLKASGALTLLYEGYNDISSTYYTYNWYNGEWFTPLETNNEFTDYRDTDASPLVVYAIYQSYTYASNTVTASIPAANWRFATAFKVLIKNDDLNMTKSASEYFLQVKDEDNKYAEAKGAWIVNPGLPSANIDSGSSNYYGFSRGVQEADGIAFYYASFKTTGYDEDAKKDVIFRLYDGTATIKSYTAADKKISTTNTACTGVALQYSKFAAE